MLAFFVRVVLAAAFLGQGIVFGLADYNNPTSSADCNIHSRQYPFTSRKDRIWQRVAQCNKSYSADEIIREAARGLEVRTSCWGTVSRRCAPLYEQHCQIENQMRGIGEMCMAKLQAHEAKERARKIAEEQAERERQHAEKQAMADRIEFRNDSVRNMTPGALDGGFRPSGDLTQSLNAGRVLAGRFSGLPITRAGALHLSAALSAESLRITQAIQDTALERFRVATRSGVERYSLGLSHEAMLAHEQQTAAHLQGLDLKLEELRALEGQLKQIAAMDDANLPVGGESAVVGEDAERLTQIAQAMVDGLLPVSLFDTPPAEAIALIEKREAVERDREARRRNTPDVFERGTANLRERRIQSAINVRNLVQEEEARRRNAQRELEIQNNGISSETCSNESTGFGPPKNLCPDELAQRLEELQKNRIPAGANETIAPLSDNKNNTSQCFEIYTQGNYHTIYNDCNYKIRIYCPDGIKFDLEEPVSRNIRPSGSCWGYPRISR